MARGKKAAQNANRRDRETLASEAESAKRAAKRAANERDGIAAKAAADLEAARAELAVLRQHVSAQTSPALVAAQPQVEQQRTQIADLEGRISGFNKLFGAFRVRLAKEMGKEFDFGRERAILRWAAGRIDADWRAFLAEHFPDVESYSLPWADMLRRWAHELDAAPGTDAAADECPACRRLHFPWCHPHGGPQSAADPGPDVYRLPDEPPDEVTELWEVRTGRRWDRYDVRGGWSVDGGKSIWPWPEPVVEAGEDGPLSTTPLAGTEGGR